MKQRLFTDKVKILKITIDCFCYNCSESSSTIGSGGIFKKSHSRTASSKKLTGMYTCSTLYSLHY